MPDFVYNNLNAPQNQQSGVADSFFFAPKYDFDTIECPPATGTNPGDTVTVADPHTFPVGKGFLEVQCLPFKNDLTATTVGDTGAQKLDQKLVVFIPGSYAELHETIKNLCNTPLIVLIKDSNCAAGMYYQLGCDCAFAWATAEFMTGNNKADKAKGFQVTFEYFNDAITLYTASVTKKP